MMIARITDADFTGEKAVYLNYISRRGSRGILLDNNNLIAMMHMTIIDCYKLPGGGIEESESKEQAFIRELKEETGYDAKIISYIGDIEEHKNQSNFMQLSHCFIAKKTSNIQQQAFTDYELELGFNLTWMTYNDALIALRKSVNICEDYFIKFMILRDEKILESISDRF